MPTSIDLSEKSKERIRKWKSLFYGSDDKIEKRDAARDLADEYFSLGSLKPAKDWIKTCVRIGGDFNDEQYKADLNTQARYETEFRKSQDEKRLNSLYKKFSQERRRSSSIEAALTLDEAAKLCKKMGKLTDTYDCYKDLYDLLFENKLLQAKTGINITILKQEIRNLGSLVGAVEEKRMENKNPNPLIELVEACPIMGNPASRQSVLNMLPDGIRNSIPFASRANTHEEVSAFVQASLNFENGLSSLLDAIGFLGGDTRQFKALKKFVEEEMPSELVVASSEVGSSPSPIPPASKSEVLKVLFLSADPSDIGRLRLGQEFSDIDRKLNEAKYREKFDLLRPQTSLTTDNFQQELLGKNPQIVHFAGHGGDTGELYFEDSAHRKIAIKISALGGVFKLLKNTVKCVVLNACYSREQAEAIAQHIPNVIGMSLPISDPAAIAFAKGFYVGLGYNEHSPNLFLDAFYVGCNQIMMDDYEVEADTPVFYQDGKLKSANPNAEVNMVRYELELLETTGNTTRSVLQASEVKDDLTKALSAQKCIVQTTRGDVVSIVALLAQNAWDNKDILVVLFGAAKPALDYLLKEKEKRATKNQKLTITVELEGMILEIETSEAESTAKLAAKFASEAPNIATKVHSKSKLKIIGKG